MSGITNNLEDSVAAKVGIRAASGTCLVLHIGMHGVRLKRWQSAEKLHNFFDDHTHQISNAYAIFIAEEKDNRKIVINQ
jgi:hypothetical protein